MRSESLTQIGVYRRVVAAPLVRVWENVLDWEHLPWLHRTSFREIDLLDAGEWGWRARVGLQPAAAGREIVLELRRDPGAECYVARTLEGFGAGTEIWTGLRPRDAGATEIEVAFRLPGVAPSQVAGLGAAYVELYTRLWDEDEGMMVWREARLREPAPAAGPAPTQNLGPLAALREKLPLVVRFAGRPFRIVAIDGELAAHAAICPHRLGPLADCEVEDGAIRCPWHGYRYDVVSGRSRDGRGLRLPPAPRVGVDPSTGDVLLIPPD